MSKRSGDWHLIKRDSDPVPGDPDDVEFEATHYKQVAKDISDQVRRLKSLSGDDSSLKGKYADELRDAFKDLAGDLDKIHDRFETAGSQLAVLAPALETARRDTKAALDMAVDEKETADKKAAADPDAEPEPDNPFERSPATQKCDTAMGNFDTIADDVARNIKSAADDDMKDSTWDKFKGIVDKVATVLKWVAKIASYLALALTILAMFIPGLNVLVLVLILTLVSLTANLLLASTGNGSWLDVAFDVVGLLTLGVGGKALKMANAARSTTLTRAARPLANAASDAAFARTAWNGGRGIRGALSVFRPSVQRAMSSAYADEVARITGRALPGRAPSRLFRPDRDTSIMADDLAGIRADFPGVDVALNHARGIKIAGISDNIGLLGEAGDKGQDVIKVGNWGLDQLNPENGNITLTPGGK